LSDDSNGKLGNEHANRGASSFSTEERFKRESVPVRLSRHNADLEAYIRQVISFPSIAALCWALKRQPTFLSLSDAPLLAPALNASTGSFQLPVLFSACRNSQNRTYYHFIPPIPSDTATSTTDAALRMFHWAILTCSSSAMMSSKAAVSTLPIAQVNN